MAGLIIGSVALNYWFNVGRKPNDLDIVGVLDNLPEHNILEVHDINPGFEYILKNNKHPRFIDKDFLFTLKVSHAEYDIHWDKTIKDIRLMQLKGCTIDYTLLRLLKDTWKVKYAFKKVNLNRPMSEFFNSNITRMYEHDYLHELVKVYDTPMHTKLKNGDSQVLISKTKWDSLSYKDRLITAAEEIWVFALERYYNQNPTVAYKKAIKQLITSSTTGFFCLFLVLNYDILLKYKNNKNYLKLYRRIYDQTKRN